MDSPVEGTAAGSSVKGTAEAAGTQLMYEHQIVSVVSSGRRKNHLPSG